MADNPLFHKGDLQSGIARAIQERKVVACFIRQDDDHWSQVWEDYWLSNNSHPTDMISDDQPPLGLIIAEHAVLLRLEFGSKEAGFLSAFVNVEKPPTMVVIKDGKVLEKLEGGIGREDFMERLVKAVGYIDGPTAPGDTMFDQDEEEELMDDIGGRQMRPDEEATAQQPTQQIPPTASSPQGQTEQSPQIQTMLAERAQRLEAERVKREAAEKAERTARANARRKEAEDAAGPDRQRSTTEHAEKERARDAWLYQQKQRKDEAKKEKQRILAQIENDKQERKAQAQRRRDAEKSAGAGAYSDMSATAPASARSVGGGQQWCNLQIRLFDGSSLRGKFASDADIATAVRTWVKEASPAGGADIPYNFRQILAPAPSKTIEVGEESKSLLELGLVPSATLVLIPVAGATEAYSNVGRGYMSSALHAAYWAANTAYGIVGSALSWVPGFGSGGPYMGGVGDEKEASNVEGARMAEADSMSQSTGSIRVKTLADQRREQQKAQQAAEFYNGNSSAFQGRKDDEEDES